MPPKKIDDTYKIGDKVKARWSGSNTFYDAKVLDVFLKTCKVEFDDGTVFNVKLSDMKSPKTEKKTEKNEEPIVKRTRSRSRSTGRNRSRSRSPARNEKKKTTVKSEKKTPSKAEKSKRDTSPKATNSVKKDQVDSISKSSLTREKIGSVKEEATTSQSSVSTSNSFIKNLYVSLEKRDSPSDVRMRSSRISSLRSSVSPPKTKVIVTTHEKANAVTKKDDAKYSDDEESDEEIKVIPKGPSKIRQTLTFLFTLLKVVLMPATFLFLAFACTKRQCTILEAPQFYSKLKDMGYALKIPFPSVVLFHLSVCLLSLVPLGKKVSGFPYGPKGFTKEYRLNGIICLILFAAIFAICSYFGLYMNWGYEKFKSLSFSIVLYCILCSLVTHVVSLIKGDGETESKIPGIGNFFNGIYFNPFLFGKVDVKTSFVRAGLIGSVLINLSILLKFFLMRGFVTVPLSLTAAMQIFFVLDYFIREEKMLSTATYTSDSVGYGFIMTTGFLVPIGLTLQTVYLYIFESKAHLTPHWCYAAMLVLYLCGYYIYMSSGNLKHNFRKNPFSPNLSDVDSIPTSQKKRLISSKMWGVVRHPNYLGLIIMAVSWTLPCGFSHFTPFGPLIMLIVALIVRCIRIESECKEKYGPAWNNYTEKVRSRLIPYIF